VCENDFLFKIAHLNIPEWRKSLTKKLTEVNGGVLGVRRVKQVEIEVTPDSARQFKNLFSSNSGNVFTSGDGPDVKLETGNRSRLKNLTLEVESFKDAEGELKKLGILKSKSNDILHVEFSGGLCFDILQG